MLYRSITVSRDYYYAYTSWRGSSTDKKEAKVCVSDKSGIFQQTNWLV